MSKAMLIIDMPDSCLECEILDRDELTCMGMKVEYGNLNIRQYFCPLKPMPQRKEFDNQIPYEKGGWNDCIDEIIGEEK